MGKMYKGRFPGPDDPGTGTPLLIAGIALFAIPGLGWIPSVICLLMFAKKRSEKAKFDRYMRYCSVIGNRECVSARELAKIVNRGTGDTRAELQEMVGKGYFGRTAYFDPSLDSLMIPMTEKAHQQSGSWLDAIKGLWNTISGNEYNPQQERSYAYSYGQAHNHFTAQAKQAEPQKQAAPEAQPKASEQQAPKPEVKKTPSKQDELENVLNELYHLNERIRDVEVSAKIDRIGELTAGIYRAVIENPKREDDVRKFMNYYLPTTLKLLKSYDLLEHQSYQGENIQASRKKIEGILDTLIEAFEKQLDRLFKNDALDIAADVDVLETMMAGDGLSSKGQMQMPGF